MSLVRAGTQRCENANSTRTAQVQRRPKFMYPVVKLSLVIKYPGSLNCLGCRLYTHLRCGKSHNNIESSPSAFVQRRPEAKSPLVSESVILKGLSSEDWQQYTHIYTYKIIWAHDVKTILKQH